MSEPCDNHGCDRSAEKDGYCLECWPECHLVECRVSSCDNYLPVCDAEEFDGYCYDHRRTYTSYERGP